MIFHIKLFIALYFILLPNFSFAGEKLEILKINTNHKAITYDKSLSEISLFSNRNDLFLEFRPILGDSLSYQYQLKGYELDWTNSKYPSVRYMNLPKGNFDLIFIAFQKDKEISRFQLKINVQKSITEVWWFYPLLCFYGLLLIGGGIYLFFLYNFRQKMKVQKLRNKLAADLHDEIGSSLSSIAIASNFMQNKYQTILPEMNQVLSQIKTDSEETVNQIRDTVWALNPENDPFEILIEKIRSFALQILVNKQINLTFENRIKAEKMPKINIDTRKNIFLMAKEAINNMAKHSEATEAQIVFAIKNEKILVEISDNGKGFDKYQINEGNGLKNFQKRANESFIDLKIDSKKGKGTLIFLEIPVI